MLFTDESCDNYNYFSFSVQLFILPGINNCLIVFIYLVFYVKVKVTQSCPTLCNPMDCTFSRPECWSGQPFPSLGDLPNPGVEPKSPTLQEDALPDEPPG